MSEIHLLVSDFPFAPGDVERLRAALGGGALVSTREAGGLEATLAAHPDTDALCGLTVLDDLMSRAPHLRWLALSSAGADRVLQAPWAHEANAPIITTANGVHAIQISEHVFSAILLWARHWPELLDLQREHVWADERAKRRLMGRELADATLLVIGLGAIGRRVAQVGRAFGMRVVATRRQVAPGERDPDVDTLAPLADLDHLLSEADYIALAVPSTPETRGLISAERLARVKRGALLVNIARGEVVDEPALLAALRSGALGGAALDVAAEEPLPPDSPLWSAPNVIISPHISGRSPRYGERLADLLLDNIARYRAGRPLRNVVDVARGY